jgi:AraC-like DNA-binding protein
VQEELPLRSGDRFAARRAPPPDYRLMFLTNPVSFESERTSALEAGRHRCWTSRWHKPPESLRATCAIRPWSMLTQLYHDSWTARVRAPAARPRHMPELADVAAQLELHPQTLRRRLAAEGTTFKELKSDIRRDMALHFLGKRTLSVEEVAYRAGFSEASAFIRAFKAGRG